MVAIGVLSGDLRLIDNYIQSTVGDGNAVVSRETPGSIKEQKNGKDKDLKFSPLLRC